MAAGQKPAEIVYDVKFTFTKGQYNDLLRKMVFAGRRNPETFIRGLVDEAPDGGRESTAADEPTPPAPADTGWQSAATPQA